MPNSETLLWLSLPLLALFIFSTYASAQAPFSEHVVHFRTATGPSGGGARSRVPRFQQVMIRVRAGDGFAKNGASQADPQQANTNSDAFGESSGRPALAQQMPSPASKTSAMGTAPNMEVGALDDHNGDRPECLRVCAMDATANNKSFTSNPIESSTATPPETPLSGHEEASLCASALQLAPDTAGGPPDCDPPIDEVATSDCLSWTASSCEPPSVLLEGESEIASELPGAGDDTTAGPETIQGNDSVAARISMRRAEAFATNGAHATNVLLQWDRQVALQSLVKQTEARRPPTAQRDRDPPETPTLLLPSGSHFADVNERSDTTASKTVTPALTPSQSDDDLKAATADRAPTTSSISPKRKLARKAIANLQDRCRNDCAGSSSSRQWHVIVIATCVIAVVVLAILLRILFRQTKRLIKGSE